MAQTKTDFYKQLVANNLVMEESPFPSELSMEAFLIDNPQVLTFGTKDKKKSKDDFETPKIIGCEISFKKEKEKVEAQKFNGTQKNDKNHSRLDLLVQYGKYEFAVLELKNVEVTKKALNQLACYLTAERRREIIDYVRNLYDDEEDYKYLGDAGELEKVLHSFTGILVGPSLDKEVETAVLSGDKSLASHWPSAVKQLKAITVNRFRNEGGDLFVFATKYEPQKKSGSGTTKYTFNQETGLGMGQLVLKVVAYYVHTLRPGVKLEELKQAFPDQIQGGFGVFRELEVAQAKNDERNEKGKKYVRYNTAQPITLADGTQIAITNQWYGEQSAQNNISKFMDQAEALKLPPITKEEE